jgi:heptaprenyl diphosphate synthase
MLASASESTTELLTQWGERFGIAFQLSDDLIDINSDSEESGKTPGTDLREHVPTLPVLLLQRNNRPEDAELLAALAGDLSADDDLSAVLQKLRIHDVMTEAQGVVAQWAEEAKASLEPLSEGPARATLEALCDYVLTRAV